MCHTFLCVIQPLKDMLSGLELLSSVSKSQKRRGLRCRVDFQNWKDEDDQEDDKEPFEEVKIRNSLKLS